MHNEVALDERTCRLISNIAFIEKDWRVGLGRSIYLFYSSVDSAPTGWTDKYCTTFQISIKIRRSRRIAIASQDWGRIGTEGAADECTSRDGTGEVRRSRAVDGQRATVPGAAARRARARSRRARRAPRPRGPAPRRPAAARVWPRPTG